MDRYSAFYDPYEMDEMYPDEDGNWCSYKDIIKLQSKYKQLMDACIKLSPWICASMSKDIKANYDPCKEYLDSCNDFLQALKESE